VSFHRNSFSFSFSNLTRLSTVFPKINHFSQIGASLGNLLQISLSPITPKVIGPFPPPLSWRYQSFCSRFRLSCITEPNQSLCTVRLPRDSHDTVPAACITELNSLFASPFTVCCTRLAQHPSSLRELEVALSLHYRNQNHSSKFSPRIWGGNQIISSHLISFHFPKISFHFSKISFRISKLIFILISIISLTVIQFRVWWHTYRVRARCHMLKIMPMQYSIISL
jgi:hypothetical protein